MPPGVWITGVDALIKKMGHVRANEYLVKPMEESVLQVQADMKEYPPPIALRTWVKADGTTGEAIGQGYKRTGTLGRRWTKRVERHANGLTGRVGNNTEYAPWVQSSSFQAWMHRGRWQTDAQVLSQRRAWIVARFKRAIDQALNRSA